MARILEGKVFYEDYNNGVYAMVSDTVYWGRAQFDRIRQKLADKGRCSFLGDGRLFDVALAETVPLPRMPIFTFVVSTPRYSESPWFTGDELILSDLRAHIRDVGGQILRRSIFVPFSNGKEMGLHGVEAQLAELKYVTTEEQFVEAFGISMGEVVKKYA